MIRWLFRIILVLVVAAAVAVWTVPLGFIIDRAGVAGQGVTWGQVQGTAWSGRVSNVAFGRQLVGDIDLKLRPAGLLTGTLAYDLSLSGPVAAGTAKVYAGGDRIGIEDADLSARVDQLIGLNASVRQAGGIVRLRGISLEVDRALNCLSASGGLWTEVLANLGAEYGETLPELDGNLQCYDQMIALDLKGVSETGIDVSIDAKVGVSDVSSFNARIGGVSGEIAQALTALGFSVSGGDFVYVRELGP
ncbi:MAG: type II secretion system protein N [Pseudomonadota bacterium]